MDATVIRLDPVLEADAADNVLALAERFGDYGMYSQEKAETDAWARIPQRLDSIRNYLGHRGLRQTDEPAEVIKARTDYFREDYAYGDETLTDGIQTFMHHPALIDAAKAVHNAEFVEPAIVFANVMVPGQELAIHTDVPEFRGANRREFPQWLLVVMAHSGLFEHYRLPIATGVAWFGHATGGDFLHWPSGAASEMQRVPVRHNTAAVLDTDAVFHGVDRVGTAEDALPPLRPGMRMRFHPGDNAGTSEPAWVISSPAKPAETTTKTAKPTETTGTPGTAVASYRWDQLRLSVSWKAYCFTDATDRDAWKNDRDKLDLTFVLKTLVADLAQRSSDGDQPSNTVQPSDTSNVLQLAVPGDREFAQLLIDTYVRFPTLPETLGS